MKYGIITLFGITLAVAVCITLWTTAQNAKWKATIKKLESFETRISAEANFDFTRVVWIETDRGRYFVCDVRPEFVSNDPYSFSYTRFTRGSSESEKFFVVPPGIWVSSPKEVVRYLRSTGCKPVDRK